MKAFGMISVDSDLKTRSQSRIFYGWYILTASFIILFFGSGAIFSVGVMFKPVISELGWSRGTFSIAFFLNMAVYALSLIIAGKVYDRYGPKWLIVISSILFSSGFIGVFFISAFWQYLALYGVVSAAGMGGITVPIFAAILSKWFEKYRDRSVYYCSIGHHACGSSGVEGILFSSWYDSACHQYFPGFFHPKG